MKFIPLENKPVPRLCTKQELEPERLYVVYKADRVQPPTCFLALRNWEDNSISLINLDSKVILSFHTIRDDRVWLDVGTVEIRQTK